MLILEKLLCLLMHGGVIDGRNRLVRNVLPDA
jgi:hypothetical protein